MDGLENLLTGLREGALQIAFLVRPCLARQVRP